MEWTAELTVGFVPLPPEKQEAYWAAIHYFAEIMFEDLLPALSQTEGRGLGEEEKQEAVKALLE
jgi:hypothetical protein